MKKKLLKAEISLLKKQNELLLQQISQDASGKTAEGYAQQNSGMNTLEMKMQESQRISSEKAQNMGKDAERDWLIEQNQKAIKDLAKQMSSFTKDLKKQQKVVSKQEERIDAIEVVAEAVGKISKICQKNNDSFKLIEQLFVECAFRAGKVPYNASLKKVVKSLIKEVRKKNSSITKWVGE